MLCIFTFRGEVSDIPSWIDPILVASNPFLLLPLALVFYLFGKGLGVFTKNEQVLLTAEINRTVFTLCFVCVFFLLFIVSVWNGGLDK
jgi:hypothetical protein